MKGKKVASEPTELDDDLAKVIRMAAPGPEALVAHGALVLGAPELVLLHVADALHDEADGEHDDPHDVPARSEVDEGVLPDGGRVDERHGQGDDPDPDHLEDPEAEEGEELVALVVEAVVLARLEDAEEQEARQPHPPQHDEDGGHDLPGVRAGPGEGEGYYREDDEVGPAGEV